MSFYGVVLEGGCRLEIDQHEPQILRAGDFILIPAAYRFALTSLTPPPSPALETIPVQLAEGHFRLGALDKPAQMQALISHCASGSTNASLLASLLPAFVVVRNQPRLATFVGLLKEEAQADRAGKSFVLARMVELLFIEAIRSSGTLATPGLMRGLSDPRVAQAIRLLHQAPARRWTVNALAADCALSRSTLFERFTDLTGMTPMGYLLGWRMTLAMQWLSETGISIADIAERIGYGSASAFSVALPVIPGYRRGNMPASGRRSLPRASPDLTGCNLRLQPALKHLQRQLSLPATGFDQTKALGQRRGARPRSDQRPGAQLACHIHLRHQGHALLAQYCGDGHLMQIVARPLRRIIQRQPAFPGIEQPGVRVLPPVNARQSVQIAQGDRHSSATPHDRPAADTPSNKKVTSMPVHAG